MVMSFRRRERDTLFTMCRDLCADAFRVTILFVFMDFNQNRMQIFTGRGKME